MENTDARIIDLVDRVNTRAEFYMNPVAYLKGATSVLQALGYTAEYISNFISEFKNKYNHVKYSYNGEFMLTCEKYFRK